MSDERRRNGSKAGNRSRSGYLGHFKTFKERGEWVELQFMAAASLRGFCVLKPWGDSQKYDVGVERGSCLLRVQVKSTSSLSGTGYLCHLHRKLWGNESYSVNDVDLFVAYVLPENAWYLIPSAAVLTPPAKYSITICPVTAYWKSRYKYEHYREAWDLLSRSRQELAATSTN
jgi:hypothetical protein